MATGKSKLVQAFHEDHALLGSGFYELSTALRGNDINVARLVAQKLNDEAGAHIAFEGSMLLPGLGESLVTTISIPFTRNISWAAMWWRVSAPSTRVGSFRPMKGFAS